MASLLVLSFLRPHPPQHPRDGLTVTTGRVTVGATASQPMVAGNLRWLSAVTAVGGDGNELTSVCVCVYFTGLGILLLSQWLTPLRLDIIEPQNRPTKLVFWYFFTFVCRNACFLALFTKSSNFVTLFCWSRSYKNRPHFCSTKLAYKKTDVLAGHY